MAPATRSTAHGASELFPGDLDFLGRDAEVAVIESLVRRAASGEEALLAIEGPAGIGKTTLLRRLIVTARSRGATVAVAQGSEVERGLAFGVVRQLFEPILATPGLRSSALAGPAHLAGAVFNHGAPDGSRTPEPFAVLHGLYWLAANLAAARPLVLAVDDLHLCDEPSLRWIGYLARRIHGLPILVGVCAGPGRAASSSSLLTEIVSNPLCHVLRPGPLDNGAVRAGVVGLLAGDVAEEFLEACRDVTGGNPFLLRELLHTLATHNVTATGEHVTMVRQLGPRSVLESVSRQVEGCSKAAVDVARATAILGECAGVGVIAEMCDLDATTVAESLHRLRTVGLLRPGPEIAFTHPIVRNAISGGLSAAQRSAWHKKAAYALRRDPASTAKAASHLLAVDPSQDPAVVEVLRLAARDAVARGAPETAATLLRRALAELPGNESHPELLLELGRAEFRASAADAIAPLEQAWRRLPDDGRSVEAAVWLAQALLVTGASDRAAAVINEVTRRAGPPLTTPDWLDSEMLGMALIREHTAAPAVKRITELAERSDFACVRPPASDREHSGILALLASHTAWRGVDRARTVELAQRAFAHRTVLQRSLVLFAHAAAALVDTDELDLARHHVSEALDDARRQGAVAPYELWSVLRAWVAFRQGDVAAAAADLHSAGVATDQPLPPPIRDFRAACLAEILIEQGRDGEAHGELASAGLTGDVAGEVLGFFALKSRGRLRMLRGDFHCALADFLELGRRAEVWGIANPATLPWRAYAATAYHQLNQPDRAKSLLSAHIEQSRRWGTARPLGTGLRIQGVVEGGSTGLRWLSQAVEILEESPARLELARALLSQGSILLRQGQAQRARAPLRRALDIAEQSGAAVLATTTHAELVASGARPRRLRQSGTRSLTPTERRIAGLVAEGHTNRRVAQMLFVTERTVELHLTNVYRKLSLRGRQQLRDLLASEA